MSALFQQWQLRTHSLAVGWRPGAISVVFSKSRIEITEILHMHTVFIFDCSMMLS